MKPKLLTLVRLNLHKLILVSEFVCSTAPGMLRLVRKKIVCIVTDVIVYYCMSLTSPPIITVEVKSEK